MPPCPAKPERPENRRPEPLTPARSFRDEDLSVELRGFEPPTFCTPSTGIIEPTSDLLLWAQISSPLASAEVRRHPVPLLYSTAVRRRPLTRAGRGSLACMTDP